MCKLRRILTLVFLSLSLVGCGSGGEDSDAAFQIEVDCSSPIFTRTEPLPSGNSSGRLDHNRKQLLEL